MDEIKKGITETERKGLPVTIQKMDGVSNIVIDSIVIVNNADPYYGYLVITWDVMVKHRNSAKESRIPHEL